MNPVATILSLPVSGPLGMLGWIARQVANAATQQLLDPTRIETALLQLEKRLEAGQIDEATFEAEEERLLGELAEITAIRAAQEKAGTEESEDAGDTEEEVDPDALAAAVVIGSAGPGNDADPGSKQPTPGAGTAPAFASAASAREPDPAGNSPPVPMRQEE